MTPADVRIRMTPHQAFTLWDATFGVESVGGSRYRPRNEAAQIAYSAVFSEQLPWKLNDLRWASVEQVAERRPELRAAAAHLRAWADAMEA